MTFEFFEVDGRSITWQIANQIARVRVDSSRSDIVQFHGFKPADRLGKSDMPPLANYEQSSQKLRVFESRVKADTRRIYLKNISNPYAKSYCVKDVSIPTNLKIVGIAESMFPEYSQPSFKVGLFDKSKILWLTFWYKIMDWVQPSPSMDGVISEYLAAAKKQGLVQDTQSFVDQFQGVDYTPTKIPLYPKQLSYYLNVFGVRSDYHGQNLGRKSFEYTVGELTKVAEKPPMLKNAPPKMIWQSAEAAQKFYEKLGGTGSPPVHTDMGVEHKPFFLDLKSKTQVKEVIYK